MKTILHVPTVDGWHYFRREDGTEVLRVYLPPKLTKAEKIDAAERLLALAMAVAS